MEVSYQLEEIPALSNDAVRLLLRNFTQHRTLLNIKRCCVLAHNAFICSSPQSSQIILLGNLLSASFIYNSFLKKGEMNIALAWDWAKSHFTFLQLPQTMAEQASSADNPLGSRNVVHCSVRKFCWSVRAWAAC